MAQLDLAAASNVMKDMYLPRLRMQLNDKLSPMFSQLEQSSQNVEGNQVVGSAHTGRNPSSGSRAEFADLPTIGRQGYEKFITDLAYHYGRAGFTGQVIRRARTDIGAFVNATSQELDRLVTDLKQMLNRQIFNDKEGFVIQASGNHTANVIPVAGATREQYISLVIGMELDIGPAGDPKSIADGVVLTAVNRTAETITVTGTLGTIVAGHYIRITDSYNDTANRTLESHGLEEIINSGDSLFNIDGTAVPVWNSFVDDNGGTLRPPTEQRFEKAMDEVSIESGKYVDLAVAPHNVVRNYAASLQGQKRYIDNVELKGGFSALPISTGDQTVGLVSDRFCTGGTSFLICTDHLVWNKASDWEWMDEDGAVLSRIANKDAYEATMFSYCTLTTDRRNTHARINDLAGVD